MLWENAMVSASGFPLNQSTHGDDWRFLFDSKPPFFCPYCGWLRNPNHQLVDGFYIPRESHDKPVFHGNPNTDQLVIRNSPIHSVFCHPNISHSLPVKPYTLMISTWSNDLDDFGNFQISVSPTYHMYLGKL